MLPKVLKKESYINSATWKNNAQNSGNILNDRFSSKQKKIWKQYIPTEEKLDDTGAEIETSSRKVFMLGGCSKWGVKILSSLENSVFKTTCIEKQSWTTPSSRIGSKKLVLQVVSRIRSQWTSWPGTHVFLDKTWSILSGNVPTSITDISVLKVPMHVTSYSAWLTSEFGMYKITGPVFLKNP